MYLLRLLSISSMLLCIGLLACQKQHDVPLPNSPEQSLHQHKPFAGQSITVMVPKLDSVRNPILDAKQAFEAETGAQVRVVTPSWHDSPAKLRQSLQGEQAGFDIYVMIAMWSSELLAGDHVAEIPPNIKKQLEWDDVLPIYRDNVLSQNGVAYGYPYDGDCINLYYRKDIFANPQYQQKFLKKYGYTLAAPQTWAQYRDVAEFFTGWDWGNNGKPNYGIVGVRGLYKNTQQQFLAQAAAFAKHPEDPAYYFNPSNMQAKINQPGFVKALQLMVDTMQFGPPELINYGSLDARARFVAGDAAMLVDWTDTPIHANDTNISQIKHKLGYAQLPGSDEVYNAKTQTWEKRFNRVSSMSGNWAFFVHKHAEYPELAMQFAAYMSSQQMTSRLMIDSTYVINPSRYSHFKNPQIWTQAGFDEADAKRYLGTIKRSLDNPNYIYDLNIPHASDYYASLDENLHLALRKQLSAQAALDKTAREWNALTKKIGIEAQTRAYRASINFANDRPKHVVS